jgi:hypothetical protein
MPQEEICYHEKSQLEAQMKVEKPHKPSIYKDEKDGFMYCGICEKTFSDNMGRWFARLVEGKRQYVRYNKIVYPDHKAKPLRHNQRITDEHLKREFEELEGEYLNVSDLKFLWGPSHGNPEGFIEINDSDRSTTVVSSSYLRRLGKITRFKWTQQRAEGENKEKLVIFRKTEEPWKDPRKRAKEEQLEKLRLLDLQEKWEDKLAELESDLSDIIVLGERPGWRSEGNDDYDYGYYGEYGLKDKERDVAALQIQIAKVQEGLGYNVTANDDNYLLDIKKRFRETYIDEIEEKDTDVSS